MLGDLQALLEPGQGDPSGQPAVFGTIDTTEGTAELRVRAVDEDELDPAAAAQLRSALLELLRTHGLQGSVT